MQKIIAKIQTVRHFSRNENGATAIEYGLIAGAIALVIIAGMALLGEGLQDAFSNISKNLSGGGAGAGEGGS